jgi:hypothetical protein
MKRKMKTAAATEFQPFYIKPEISVEEAQVILCKYGATYTDQEIKEIIVLMQNLVEIDYTIFKRKQAAKALQGKDKTISGNQE